MSDKGAPCPLDRVNRQFRAAGPDRLWVSDFTYVATSRRHTTMEARGRSTRSSVLDRHNLRTARARGVCHEASFQGAASLKARTRGRQAINRLRTKVGEPTMDTELLQAQD